MLALLRNHRLYQQADIFLFLLNILRLLLSFSEMSPCFTTLWKWYCLIFENGKNGTLLRLFCAACQLVTLLSRTETNVLFDVDIVVKTKRPWISVVCTLIETIFVITVVKICYELTRLCLVSPQRLWNLSIGFATVFSTNLLARPRARTMSYQHSKKNSLINSLINFNSKLLLHRSWNWKLSAKLTIKKGSPVYCVCISSL